jgi:hypothetical protein
VGRHDLLNAERRWSYPVFLAALARYLDLKAEAGKCDAIYGYAQASLLNYARWMLDHERPYYDRGEQLEFHTEAWGGQELRKANVLRLAATHAEPALRMRLLERARELADRAWYDFLRFPGRTSARGLALMMCEGTTDSYFRNESAPVAATGPTPSAWPSQQELVPQKLRVLRRLKTPGGLARSCLRLLNAVRWARLWLVRRAYSTSEGHSAC